MEERLICEHCDDRKLPTRAEEEKGEETFCVYCPKSEEMRAVCLFKGKPACINCKVNHKSQTKSPAGSIRSERIEYPVRSVYPEKKVMRTGTSFDELESPFRSPTSMSGAQEYVNKIEQTLSRARHSRNSSQVNTEFLKANSFLQKYVNNNFTEITSLYDSHMDGYSARSFHDKCDDSKGGIILILSLGTGYEIAAFSWKGIRKGSRECSDVQVGGAIIRNKQVEFVPFQDQFVINEPEGIRFSRKNDLYINFDNLSASLCNFDKKLAKNPKWTSWIQEISVYKLQQA